MNRRCGHFEFEISVSLLCRYRQWIRCEKVLRSNQTSLNFWIMPQKWKMTKKQNCPQIIIFFYCAVEQADGTAVIWCGGVKDAWPSASELFCILSLFSLFQCPWVLSLAAARNILESTSQIWELFHSDFIITLNQVDSSCINWFLVFWAQSMSTRWQMQDARGKWDNFGNNSSIWLSSTFL